MEIFERTKAFPPEERFVMTDQMRRASRSVCANLGEAWRRRESPRHFASKLNDAEAEAEETRVWLDLAHRCGYISAVTSADLHARYDAIIAQLVHMATHTDDWRIR